MPKNQTVKRRTRKERLNLRKGKGKPRKGTSMDESTYKRLTKSAKASGVKSIGAEINRLIDNDALLTRVLATKGPTDAD